MIWIILTSLSESEKTIEFILVIWIINFECVNGHVIVKAGVAVSCVKRCPVWVVIRALDNPDFQMTRRCYWCVRLDWVVSWMDLLFFEVVFDPVVFNIIWEVCIVSVKINDIFGFIDATEYIQWCNWNDIFIRHISTAFLAHFPDDSICKYICKFYSFDIAFFYSF